MILRLLLASQIFPAPRLLSLWPQCRKYFPRHGFCILIPCLFSGFETAARLYWSFPLPVQIKWPSATFWLYFTYSLFSSPLHLLETVSIYFMYNPFSFSLHLLETASNFTCINHRVRCPWTFTATRCPLRVSVASLITLLPSLSSTTCSLNRAAINYACWDTKLSLVLFSPASRWGSSSLTIFLKSVIDYCL
jgi:hypothetical protein